MTDRKDFEGEASENLEDVRDDEGEARAERQIEAADLVAKGQRVRIALKANLGDDVYSSWFASLEFQSFDGTTLKASVPVKFLKTWIQTHYSEALLASCALEFKGVQKIEIVQRQPVGTGTRPALAAGAPQAASEYSAGSQPGADTRRVSGGRIASHLQPTGSRLQVNGLEGSPLDPRYTFDSFMVGAANRMAHAGATQVADTVFADERGFNPLYIHSPVGHGKTHLLHAIAWEVAAPGAARAGALPDGRALSLSVCGGPESAGRHGLQGPLPLDRHAADRRPRVHAGREDRAGVRPHHQLAARRRTPARGRLRARTRSTGCSTTACARGCNAGSSPR